MSLNSEGQDCLVYMIKKKADILDNLLFGS